MCFVIFFHLCFLYFVFYVKLKEMFKVAVIAAFTNYFFSMNIVLFIVFFSLLLASFVRPLEDGHAVTYCCVYFGQLFRELHLLYIFSDEPLILYSCWCVATWGQIMCYFYYFDWYKHTALVYPSLFVHHLLFYTFLCIKLIRAPFLTISILFSSVASGLSRRNPPEPSQKKKRYTFAS